MDGSQFRVSQQLSGETHSQYALRNIRKNVMECRLKPGEQINEGELAALLGISRTPVHEAVLSLRDERLVDVIPRKESRVSLIDLGLVNEGVFLRCSVEPELIRALSGNISKEYLNPLRSNLIRQEEIFSRGVNLGEYYDEDDEFHHLLYLAANKEQCYQAVHTICSHLDRVRFLVRLEDDTSIEHASLEEHRQLLMYLSLGLDPTVDLGLAFRRHIMRFQSMLPKYMEKHPDYFSVSAQ